ncbi:MAG: DUF4340 domain-containing protein [Opitutaceae bacterium]|nr:DUF4340 domain-containing protein [Opitutaceae bacterium]
MRTKVTLVLLFLNVALFYYIFQFLDPFRPPQPHSRKVLPPEVAAIERLEVRRTDTAPLVFEKRGDTWYLGAPYDWPADRNAIERLLNELRLLEHETSFEVSKLPDTGQKLADYGLAPAGIVLVLGSGEKRLELPIGAATQVRNRLYVLSPDGTRIHVVGRSLVEALQLTPDQLRDTSLIDIPVFEARTLAVQVSAPGNLRVRLARPVGGQRWMFESPIQTRADKNAVELALNRLRELRVASFLDAPDARATGLENPALRLTVEGTRRRSILLLGAPVSSEPKIGAHFAETELFAKLEDRAAVFTVKVEDALLDSLHNAQSALRDRHLLDFEPARLTAISLRSPGQPEVSLQRLETGAWQVLDRQTAETPLPQAADAAIVARLMTQLGQLSADAFHSDAPLPAELEQWGFNRPEREVTLTLSPENGATTPSATAPALTLQIGVTGNEAGKPFAYARVAGAQFVYRVRADILAELPVVARQYRERTLRALPPGARITGLKLTRLADASEVFARDLPAGQTWETALAAEKTETQAAVLKLLEELRTLRARDFVRDSFAQQPEIDGQPRPWVYQLDLSIALSGAGEENQAIHSTLFLGERQGGTTQLVGSAEFNTLFHASQTFLDATFALTFGPRDPGPPPPSPPATNGDQPAPAPAPAAASEPTPVATPPAPAAATP